MNILNLIKEFKKVNKLELVPVKSFEFQCPYCHAEIIRYNLEKNKLSYEVWRNLDSKGYIYTDGDTIMNIEKNIKLTLKQYNAEMLQGKCRSCNKQYVGICIDLINRPIEKDDYFCICDDSILYENNVTSELLQININGSKIGTLSIFKNVENIDSSNTSYDVYRIELGIFESSEDLSGEHGVSCCSEKQYNIWNYATELCQLIINDLFNNYKYLK